MDWQVFVIDSAEVPHAQDVEVEQEVLEGCASVRLLHLNSEADFAPQCDLAGAIILWHQISLTADTIRRLRHVRLIVRNGVGFENVDAVTAGECGIAVCNVPDYGTEEVADHALTLCLALNRQLGPLHDDALKGKWHWQTALKCRRVRGQVFGIVGCGRIGTAVALRAKAFGYDVRFYDPYLPSGYEKAIGTGRTNTLEELLSASDVVSLHVPLTGETHHMIDIEQLMRMKRTAHLVNTARGAVVRHAALEHALAEAWIAGAGLDVLEHEPIGLNIATRFPNCIVTPHSAFYSQESILEMRRTSAGIIRDALLYGRFRNVVNRVVETNPA